MSDMSAFEDHELRFDKMFWIPSMLHASDLPDSVDELIEDLEMGTRCPLLQQLPWLQIFLAGLEDGERPYEIREKLREQLYEVKDRGFIVQAARPVHEYHADGKSASYSWGHYNTAWLYGATLEGVIAEAISWADGLSAKEKALASLSQTEVK